VIGGKSLLVALGCAALLASAAHAQQLRDPTRPPSFLRAAPAGAEADSESGLVLQTVLLSRERRNAVISGRLLQLGDSISGMRVVDIRESAVTLAGRGESLTLQLFPAVEKRRPNVGGSVPEPERRPTRSGGSG
jgi:MSHA biogenesis protein MshK